ncbi:MAG: DJ-1/PfpI family protein [Pseudomonadota bacterium]
MKLDRRTFAAIAALSSLGILPRRANAQMELPSGSPRADIDAVLHDMSVWPEDWVGSEKVVMLAYPGMTILDLIGPQYMFACLTGASVLIAAKTKDPIRSDTGITILPDITFTEATDTPDILFAPGGISGTLNAMEDKETVDFLASRGKRARYVTSVCTGSLLLGQAGLLDGYKATSHWLALNSLDAFGAKAINERVVHDRNRITGAGVTSGLDFGLTMLEELRGKEFAQSIQLFAEYAPEPPLSAGTLDGAPDRVKKIAVGMFPGFDAHIRAVASIAR